MIEMPLDQVGLVNMISPRERLARALEREDLGFKWDFRYVNSCALRAEETS